MCRFALYLGSPILMSSLVTEPAHSIIHQSVHSREREEPLNGDGFGVAWYASDIRPEPVVFKDVSPAWSNLNLANLAPVTRSHCILAHIRAASPGLPVAQLNCHPFAWDRFAFMHNGDVGGFREIVRLLREGLSGDAYHRVQGSTDSEHVFALFGDHYEQCPEDDDELERMAGAMVDAITSVVGLQRMSNVDTPCFLNLVVADGARAVVTRFTTAAPERAPSLYVHEGDAYVCEDGVCRMVHAQGEAGAVLVASEPLSDDPGWTQVAPNHMVLVREDRHVEHRAMEID